MEKNKKTVLRKIFGAKGSDNETSLSKKCTVCGEENRPDVRFCSSCGSAFASASDHFDAFVSYRRETGSDLASLLKIQLENNFHKRIFLDIKELQVGRFDEALLHRIEETPNFILILSKSSLDRCKDKSDWLKREIMHALATRRNIIPLLIKDFDFPSEDLWGLLPSEMRVLSSLNGIKYDHIHQDSAIRMVASYMKSEEEVPPVHFVPGPVETVPPPPPGRGASTPGPTTPGPTTPGPTTPDPQHIPYFPVTGIMVVDSAGSETILTEFGVRADSYAQLESADRDDLSVGIGQGIKPVPWGLIESVEIQSQNDAIINLSDGTSMDHVKLIPSRLVGKNEQDLSFVFEFKNPLKISTLRDTTLLQREELIRKIPVLVNRANPQARRSTLTLRPDGKEVIINVDEFLYSELKSTHIFRLPGPHKFSANGKFVVFTVSQDVGENFTMGPFPVETALALTLAINRLNTMLSDNNKDTGEKEDTPLNRDPECLVILKRGENLTVGARDSKIRSVYYGPGTVLQYIEKGKGEVYPWYRFRGADGKDFWLEGPGPVDTIDRRVFFRIAETGQVGYVVELLGDRTDPWGSLEEFKFEDDIVGPTVVRFDQIVSMTSENGIISVQKKTGVVSGSLQKLVNYNYGSYTKGPCLVTRDAVIPLVRTNRAGSLTITRIKESEKPPLTPVPIYSDKTLLKFILQANSSVGHFDEITPDIYIQLDEKALGRMRISIPRIVSISVDPECKETPVTVETKEGRVYRGTCLDPFNFSGSVITFDKVKKRLVLEGIDLKPGDTNNRLPIADEQKQSPSPRLLLSDGDASKSVKIKDSWMMKTTDGPGKRSDFGMAYDDKQEVIILHGGFGQGNAGNRPFGMPALNSMPPEQHDTWTWDGSSWRLLSNDSPGLVSHALAFCKKTEQNIISGGWTGSRRMNDTYILTGDKWTKAETAIEFFKGGFQNHVMVYDEKRKTLVLFGGLTVMFPAVQIPLGDTWEWNGLAWSRLNVKGPEPRWGHQMAYDHSMGTILLFGGYDGKKFYDDTWIWKGNEASWEKVSVESAPSARYNHAMTCDILRGRIMMFGGLSESKIPLNDLWEWNGSTWTILMEQAPPKPRYNHGFVYDIKRNKSILFGGYDGKEHFQDTWEFAY